MTEKLKPVTAWIERGGEWLRTKVFEPFGKWLNDPQTGVITRMREATASFFYGKKDDEGNRKGGVFGWMKTRMDTFFYGDKEKGTKGFVERVVELPAKPPPIPEMVGKVAVRDRGAGRPTKRERRVMDAFRGTGPGRGR